jgi:hypothetical protein
MADHDNATPRPSSGSRDLFLAAVLTLFIGGSFLILLIFLSGGFLLYAVLAALLLGGLCLFHWLVWGWGMSAAVQGEREELEIRRRAEEDEDPDAPPWERRFS